MHILHRPQMGKKLAATWSPGSRWVTSGPTSTTTPPPSCPPTMGKRPVLTGWPVPASEPISLDCRCSSE